jgi:hypothetical protein
MMMIAANTNKSPTISLGQRDNLAHFHAARLSHRLDGRGIKSSPTQLSPRRR